MAIIQYKGIDKSVDTISERNSLVYKIDNMVVLVKDAIADPSAGAGKATYRYDLSDESWVLISKSTSETVSFATEELSIVNGQVTASNIPTDNQIWNALVLDGDVVVGEIRSTDMLISAGVISSLELYNGKKLRFTYAYGTITSQVGAVLDIKANSADVYTKTEVDDIVASGLNLDIIGSIEDFEGELV